MRARVVGGVGAREHCLFNKPHKRARFCLQIMTPMSLQQRDDAALAVSRLSKNDDKKKKKKNEKLTCTFKVEPGIGSILPVSYETQPPHKNDHRPQPFTIFNTSMTSIQ